MLDSAAATAAAEGQMRSRQHLPFCSCWRDCQPRRPHHPARSWLSCTRSGNHPCLGQCADQGPAGGQAQHVLLAAYPPQHPSRKPQRLLLGPHPHLVTQSPSYTGGKPWVRSAGPMTQLHAYGSGHFWPALRHALQPAATAPPCSAAPTPTLTHRSYRLRHTTMLGVGRDASQCHLPRVCGDALQAVKQPVGMHGLLCMLSTIVRCLRFVEGQRSLAHLHTRDGSGNDW